MNPRILFVGHGRAGKDSACDYFSRVTGLKNAGTTSKYLAKYVFESGEIGIDKPFATVEDIYASRHKDVATREVWKRIGDRVRENDPTLLIREALKHGDISGGVRDRVEVAYAVSQGEVDLVVWVENKRVQPDPTVTFGPEECDLVIENHGSMREFHSKLRRLAFFAGLVPETTGMCQDQFFALDLDMFKVPGYS